ncbi:MAG: hypothetical protein AW12_00152 [Candidatus Accumulibacter sp. BA-94]|uniref:DUF2784 domain-containing protein n=1 Tax=Accumulibacter sp. TaxID=2053492 RepID=UPI00044519E4|nr:DUF2784 domain-containing protein [Accumulibacter sp.]EXI92994.1 MAG: hypothetical protein AW12_00152 [Candidatus Accumulibacter sp. BA-94]MBL8392162.1 DUF2784 domain-containing protein [Accumulibacter sp.]HRD88775.1 DUF2784 domain-containing protein [Accumulibacter sp.]
MSARLLADGIVVVHFLFIAFVVAGGALCLRWPRLACAHVPAACWGVLIEITGWICPLTPLENELRQAAGQAGYAGGFIEHYLLPVIYPPGLTRGTQLMLAGVLIAINLACYGWLIQRHRSACKLLHGQRRNPVDAAE